MSCLIPLFVSCLLDPSHVTIRADSHWLVTHRDFYYMEPTKTYHGALGRIEITGGGDLSPSLRLYYGLGHQSFLGTIHDSGYEYVVAGFEWRPFKTGN